MTDVSSVKAKSALSTQVPFSSKLALCVEVSGKALVTDTTGNGSPFSSRKPTSRSLSGASALVGLAVEALTVMRA